jgi:hypothetical protein
MTLRTISPNLSPMNVENTQRLFDHFDHMYRGRYLPDMDNLMCHEFCCDNGWFTLIWQLSEQVAAYTQTHPEAVDLMVVQVKQKLGELRFYTQPKIWDIEYLIEDARIRSLHTCEITGDPGVLCQRLLSPGFCYYQTLSPAKAAELGFVPAQSSRLHPQLPPRSSVKSDGTDH